MHLGTIKNRVEFWRQLHVYSAANLVNFKIACRSAIVLLLGNDVPTYLNWLLVHTIGSLDFPFKSLPKLIGIEPLIFTNISLPIIIFLGSVNEWKLKIDFIYFDLKKILIWIQPTISDFKLKFMFMWWINLNWILLKHFTLNFDVGIVGKFVKTNIVW